MDRRPGRTPAASASPWTTPQLAARTPAPLRPEPVPHVLVHEHVRVELRHL